MLLSDLEFDLPEELIAYQPPDVRGNDRLLRLDKNSGQYSDHAFTSLPDLLPQHSLLVFNDSKVHKARLMAMSETGSRVEFLLIRPLQPGRWLCLVEKSKRQKIGRVYILPDDNTAKILAEETDGLKIVEFSRMDDEYLELYGQIPLPPYIKRAATAEDNQRYQTVYARVTGSAAAPTAGLHFTQDMLKQLSERGCDLAFLTLHVGLGTFAPIRTDRVEDHIMHSEEYEISEETTQQINTALRNNQPIIPIGTTSCRTLESAFDKSSGQVLSGKRDTQIFIYPGYQFRVASGLFTNFHTPGSTLLAMVSALAGYQNIRHAYAHAVENRYRFFSYGDSMLIL